MGFPFGRLPAGEQGDFHAQGRESPASPRFRMFRQTRFALRANRAITAQAVLV